MQKYNGQLIRQFASPVSGNAASGVTVRVERLSDGVTATLYVDNNAAGATLPNPITVSSTGHFSFYAADGVYTLTFSDNTPQQVIQLQDLVELQQQFDNAVLTAGYIPSGTFAAGATLTQANQVLSDGSSYWRWDGSFPKTVTAGSAPTPTGVGGWIVLSDFALRGDLNSASSTVPVGGFQAKHLGNIQGNSSRAHFSIGAIPRCKTDGVFELINDTVHNPMNVASVTQPDQYTIRINYARTATKINTFIAAPDAELAPFGVVCGGDVGTSFANIQAYAPLNFIADNNTTPNITLNALWQPSYASGSITAVRVNASTLRVTHPPVTSGDSPVVTPVNASRPCEYVVSFGSTQVDIVCVGQAKGYISYSGSAWSQAFSENVTAPTLTWTASNTLKIDHGVAYGGSVVPVLTGHGGAYIPQIVNYGSTFIEVAFYDYAGTKVTTQGAGMQLWYTLDGLKVPCNWPTGNIVSVQRGMVHVPSYNFKGVTGNNLWVSGDFEYA